VLGTVLHRNTVVYSILVYGIRKAKQSKEVLTKAQAIASVPYKLHITQFIQNVHY